MKLRASESGSVSHGPSIHFRPQEGRAPRRASSFSTTMSRSTWGPVTGHSRPLRGGCVWARLFSHSPVTAREWEVSLCCAPKGQPPPNPVTVTHRCTRRITVQRATSFKTRLLRGTRLLRPHYAESRPPGGSPAPGATALHGTAGMASSGPFWGFWATRENSVQEGN